MRTNKRKYVRVSRWRLAMAAHRRGRLGGGGSCRGGGFREGDVVGASDCGGPPVPRTWEGS